MTQDSAAAAASRFEAAFAGPGLPAVPLGPPAQLTLRLLNQGPTSYLTPLAADEADRARLVLALDAAGATLAGPVPDAPPGFRFEADPAGTTLTLWQTAPLWQWFAGETLTVPLPDLVFAGAEGVRRLSLTLSHLTPGQAASLAAVLACLAGPVPTPADPDPEPGGDPEPAWPGPRAVGDDVKVDLFEVTPKTLSGVAGPTPVRLSWRVSNADYVAITGLGKVAAEGHEVPAYLERTTTFVLTAYAAGLSQLATAQQQVLVTPAPVPDFVPAGVIMLWSGFPVSIPPGWALCDGDNKTPDLRDRFVLGAMGLAAPWAKGSADKHTHKVEEYEEVFRTDEAGEHVHLLNLPPATLGALWQAVQTGNLTGSRLRETGPAGEHAHRVLVRIGPSTTNEATGSNRPDWFALCYIMKRFN